MSINLKLTSIRIDQGTTDGEVTVIMKPKYTEARTYSLPRECLDQMIADIHAMGISPQVKSPQVKPADKLNQTTVRAPKKWMVGSGLPKHKVVLLIFDPQTEAQSGFALSAEAATEMAAGLAKNAEVLKTHASGQQNGGTG